jgi:hypothetical protein
MDISFNWLRLIRLNVVADLCRYRSFSELLSEQLVRDDFSEETDDFAKPGVHETGLAFAIDDRRTPPAAPRQNAAPKSNSVEVRLRPSVMATPNDPLFPDRHRQKNRAVFVFAVPAMAYA